MTRVGQRPAEEVSGCAVVAVVWCHPSVARRGKRGSLASGQMPEQHGQLAAPRCSPAWAPQSSFSSISGLWIEKAKMETVAWMFWGVLPSVIVSHVTLQPPSVWASK